jgi:hypothetical protein
VVRLSAQEQKWLARIILQDLKIGMKEEGILGYFSERAMEIYEATSDLRYVCGVLSEGCVRVYGFCCPHTQTHTDTQTDRQTHTHTHTHTHTYR